MNLADRPAFGTTQTETKEDVNDNLILFEMLIIIGLIFFCGVVYALWKYLVDRRHAQREANVLMSPLLVSSDKEDHQMNNGPRILMEAENTGMGL